MKEILYKDSSLSTTIEKIRNILSDNEITVTEKIHEGFEGVFSVRLTINDVGLGVNGKGLSKEIALASAYGELMERIQNFALYKFTFPAVFEISNTKFHYAPDEISVTCDQYLDYIKIFIDAINLNDISINELTKINLSYEQENNIFFCIPYIDKASGTAINLPAKLVEHIYLSNGMAAGNSYSEALVQSISEIFERYANKIIVEGKLVPPDLPLEKIKFMPNMLNILSLIKRKGNYEIIFKDCSLGMGLPVVGMYFIDKDTGKYFIKFGAHPILRIAAERTITELFQGRKFINSNLWLKSFSFVEHKNIERNFEKIFRDGNGIYPYAIFCEKSSYELTDSWFVDDRSDIDNNVLLDFLLKIIIRNNWKLLYRNVSFMGFPTVHVIIPEISYVNTVDKNYIKKQNEFSRVKQCLANINNCGDDDLLNIINFIDKNYYMPYDTILPLTGLPLSETNIFHKTNNLYFKFLLYSKIKRFEEAITNLDSFILNNNLFNSKNGTIYRCLRETYYALKIKKIKNQEVIEVLNKIYDKNIINAVITMLSNDRYLEEFHQLVCFCCDSCEDIKECRYPQIVKFHEKLAEKYLKWMEEDRNASII